MRTTGSDGDLVELRRRAEQALAAARPRPQVEAALRALAEKAPDGSDDARFAHRQLAEIVLEESPWSAALHLRRVLQHDDADDIAHALMGLCQALQGNYRMAVGSYRRAVAISPGNPWYNHNLGHLLDVAVGAPSEALAYLRKAHRAQPLQEEVGASLAHCLGRVGLAQEGAAVARRLLTKHPHHEDLKKLAAWLEQGAPARGAEAKVSLSGISSTPRGPAEPRELPSPDLAIQGAVRKSLRAAGMPDELVDRALRLWSDLRAVARRERDPLPSNAWAAAMEYALARVDGRAASQRELAQRYSIHPSTLSTRYQTLRALLQLAPRDTRYGTAER